MKGHTESQSRVEERFLADYFPRWRRKQEWTACVGIPTDFAGHDGLCDLEARTVFVSQAVAERPDDELDLVLIHEVVHALKGRSHGNPFRSRMTAAVQRAKSLGRRRLAHPLAHEVEQYDAPAQRAADIYARLREIALHTDDFDTALRGLAHEQGVTPDWLLKHYRRIRREWADAVSFAQMVKGER